MQEYVKVDIKDQIGFIEFFHPQSNSLPNYILKKLAQSITEAGKNPEIKVIVLKSGGERAFCAGASFDELIQINNLKQGEKFFSGFADVINAIRKCPKFIIGRVQGKTVGGGVGIACAVDYCFATKYASAKLSELAIGIGPFVVGPAVERKLKTSAFSAMSINADKWFDANWAKEQGMYAEVFESNGNMDEEIKSLTSKLIKYSPEAMKSLKNILWKDAQEWDTLLYERAKISGELVLSEFAKETILKIKNGIS